MQKISGVYKITNKITGDLYIGSSVNIEHRWANHKSPSTWAAKSGMMLYQAMAQYGLNNFIFEIIEKTNNLREREQYWIEQLHPTYNSNRAKGLDEEKVKENAKEYYKSHEEKVKENAKEYYKGHKEKVKEYYKSHSDKWNSYQKEYQSRFCLYQGETLTLETLYHRFRKQKIARPFREAKKYLIIN